MKKSRQYLLVHRITRRPLGLPHAPFTSETAAAVFALEHDLHVDIVPASPDLFGEVVPDPERGDPAENLEDRSLPLG